MLRIFKFFATGTRAVSGFAAAAMVLAVTSASAQAESPFASLVGTWSGGGTASFDSGKKESLRCRGYYTNGGVDALGLSIRCANASAKVELRANLKHANGRVTGNWEERTYNQAGTITGTATGSNLNLAINGPISGSLRVSVANRKHSVVVSTGGSVLKGINISMRR